MIVFLLLMIIAILLLGSSVVIGAIGYVLGLVAAIAALAVLSFWLNIDPLHLVLWGIVGIAALVLLGRFLDRLTARQRAKVAAELRATNLELDRQMEAARQASEETQRVEREAAATKRAAHFRLQNANPNRKT